MTGLSFATGRRFDVIGLGNAIADLIAETPEDFLARHDVPKGAMRLLESEEAAAALAEELRRSPNFTASSGGSAANSICGLQALGRNCAFIGKVSDDLPGGEFTEDLRRCGVYFASTPTKDFATGQCCIAVTPDKERSMATYLGAARELTQEDIKSAPITQSAAIYIETYLWDDGDLQALIKQAIDVARGADVRVALSLSDPFCVERHYDSLSALLESDKVDVLFGNSEEFSAMFPGKSDAELAAFFNARNCVAFRTKGAQGAGAFSGGEYTEVPAIKNVAVADVTGAGDLFAAGALFSLLGNPSVRLAVQTGIVAASHVIAHMGGRAGADLPQKIAAMR